LIVVANANDVIINKSKNRFIIAILHPPVLNVYKQKTPLLQGSCLNPLGGG